MCIKFLIASKLISCCTVQGTLRNTDCWFEVLVPHWVWQTFAVNACIPSDPGCMLRPRKEISHTAGMTAVGSTPYSDCYCTPDPLACSYNSKLLSCEYHYQQFCEPNVGTTGRASVITQSRRVGGWIRGSSFGGRVV